MIVINASDRRRAAAVTERSVGLEGDAIARARAGDQDALHFLYVRYADTVYACARGLIRDDHEAEDITQQVFAKLVTSLAKYEPTQVPFAAWISRVTRNVAIDTIRRRRAVPAEEVYTSDTAATSIAYERATALRDALGTLPEDQREVLVLRHIVGLSPSEIAIRLGKTESSVHGLHHRGRGALRTTLREFGVAPATVAA